MARAFWLLKSEPEVYPFSQLVTERTTLWEGVRNHQARNNLAAMAISARTGSVFIVPAMENSGCL